MCQQVPMVFLLFLVYLGAVAYISMETSCAHVSSGIKDQRPSINLKLQLFMTLCDIQSLSGNYSMRHQEPMVFLLLLVYLSAAACIPEEKKWVHVGARIF